MHTNQPPWVAAMQALADQADADRARRGIETQKSLARDITNAAYEDVIGHRPVTHRKDA